MKKARLCFLLSALLSGPVSAACYGPEQVTDGGFSNGGAFWTLGDSWQTIPGYAFHNEGHSLPISQPAIDVIPGRTYKASYTISGSYTSTHPIHFFRLEGDYYSNCPIKSGDGTFTCQLTAPDGVHTLMVQSSSGFAGVLDDVSVREVLP